MKIAFLADFFVEDGINGGGELNNEELIKLLINKGNDVKKYHTHGLAIQNLPDKETKLIVANFVALTEEVKDHIKEKLGYNAQITSQSNLEKVSPHYERVMKALEEAEQIKESTISASKTPNFLLGDAVQHFEGVIKELNDHRKVVKTF